MNNYSAFINIIIFNNNNNNFFFSTEDYKVFFLFFEELISTVDNTVGKFIIKFNIFLELLFLRRPRRIKKFSTNIINIITSYIF